MTKNKKLLIVANWKMNPDNIEKAKEIFKGIRVVTKELKNISTVVCPPFIYLSDLEKINDGSIVLGAQDVFWENEGSFTGEISPTMLKNEGEGYVIVGHSERRSLGENDEMISKKIKSAIKIGLKVILCIGERDRDIHGEYLHFLRQQIINSIGNLSKKSLEKLVIAYEPIWAIGKKDNEAMKANELHEMTIFIKKVMVEIYGQKYGLITPVLYGGSVTYKNAEDLITQGQVQGLLIGRESLKVENFGKLLKDLEK